VIGDYMRRFAFIIMFSYFLLYSFDAPLQYFSILIGLQPLFIFLKLVLPLLLIILGFIKVILNQRIEKKLFYIILLSFFAIIIGLFNGLPFIQIAYGIKTLMPLLASFFYFAYFYKGEYDFKILFRILMPIVIIGLLLDKFVDLPWSDISYQIGNYERQVSRSWETFGIERLSGFQAASYDSAVLIVILIILHGISEFIKPTSQWVMRFLDSILLLSAVYGIYLTTFKSAYLFVIVYIMFNVIKNYYKKTNNQEKKFAGFLMKTILLLVFLYGLLPPTLSVLGFSLFNFYNTNSNFLINFLFKSYSVRMQETWPNATDLLDFARFGGFLGRGIGGIGTAQKYAEPFMYNPGDNLFIFLFITIGILTVPLIIAFLRLIIGLNFLKNDWFILSCMLLLIFCFGATINFVDSPLLMAIVGSLLALYIKTKQSHIKEKVTL
jgi:hypothetical protein